MPDEVALRIEVDAARPLPALRDRREEVERRGRLADAALLIEHRDRCHGPRFYKAPRAACGDQMHALADLRDDDLGDDHHGEDRDQDQRDPVPLEQVQRGVERHADAAGADQAQHRRLAHVDVPAEQRDRPERGLHLRPVAEESCASATARRPRSALRSGRAAPPPAPRRRACRRSRSSGTRSPACPRARRARRCRRTAAPTPAS